MVVRFVPNPEPRETPATSREDLAEVIDLRARMIPRDDLEAAKTRHPSGKTGPQPVISARTVEPVRDLQEDGVRALARRALSSGELRRKLMSLGHPELEVDDLIASFEASHYLDDLGLARTLTMKLREGKRASRLQIRRKLTERLLPSQTIEEVLGDLDEQDENELLEAAAHERAQRLASLDRVVAERRLLGYLARRGWSGSRATAIAREALDAVSQ